MDLVDILIYGKSMDSAQRPSEYLQELCALTKCDVNENSSNAELEEKLRGSLTPWEIDKQSREDVLGSFTVVTSSSDIVSGDTVMTGTVRLKEGAGEFIPEAPFVSLPCAVDLSNLPPICSALKTSAMLAGSYQRLPFFPQAVSRLILPETYPQMRNSSNGVLYGKLPECSPCAPKVLLSKHFAVHTTNSSMFTGYTSSKITEEFVYAPKDMDAQFHLDKFTKMSAETIVAILENLADVTDREDSYTLTLGTTNLDKLTEEQKNIAIEKGWNLA